MNRVKKILGMVLFVAALGVACKVYSPERPNTPLTVGGSDPVLYLDTLVPSPLDYEDHDNSGKNREPVVAAYTSAQWHGFTQARRNQLLLDAAIRDMQNYNGARTPWNCKTWIQRIVPVGSGGVEFVPQTSMPNECPRADGWTWCSGSHAAVVLQNFCPINFTSHFKPGMILQTWWGGNYKPHTAMVYSVTPTSITLIDCNAVGPNVIGTHTLSQSQFATTVRAFTLYEIR